jgi:hypothetical protein
MRRVEVTHEGLILGGRSLKRGERLDAGEFGEETAARLVHSKRLRYVSEPAEEKPAPAPRKTATKAEKPAAEG